MTIEAAWINEDARSGAGNWEEYFSDISFYRQDGTVTPIFDRQTNVSYPSFGFPWGGVINQTFEVNIAQNDAWEPRDTTTYYIGDHLGSTRLTASGSGWPMSSDTFYPFGQEQNPSADPNHYKFATLERDAESGLDHATFRQLSSAQGRWLSPDPYDGSYDLNYPQTLNRYAYVGNNPLGYTDPSGENICAATTAFGFAFGGPAGGTVGTVACVANLVYDAFRGIEDLFGLFSHPTFHGSTSPRPNAQPWDENQFPIHYGPNIGGALGLPSGGCEFGACGGGGFGFQSPDCGCQPLQLPQVQGYPYWLIPTPFLSNWAQQLYDTMSQHGSGNQADTGVMQDVYRLYPKLPVCDALDLLLDAAKAAGDQKKIAAITKTKKAWGCKRSRASR